MDHQVWLANLWLVFANYYLVWLFIARFVFAYYYNIWLGIVRLVLVITIWYDCLLYG